MPTEGRPELSDAEFELRPGFREDLPDLQEVFELPRPARGTRPRRARRTRCGHGSGPCSTGPAASSGWRPGTSTRWGSSCWRGTGSTCSSCIPTGPRVGWVPRCSSSSRACARRGFGLRVYQANDRARAFYLKHGLVELERTDGSGYLDAEPDVQMAWLGEDPLAYLRRRIDAVDDELAVLLARRTALTGAVQDHKAATGESAGQRS